MSIVTFVLRYRLWIILAATLAVGGAFVPGFLSLQTLALSLDRGTTMGIIAVGMTVVLIAGRIDLSSGSILAACGILMVQLQPLVGAWPAIAVALAAGAAFGLLNAMIVVRLSINSMIATLATMLGIRSLAHLMTDSRPVSGEDWQFGAALTGDLVGIFSSRVVIFIVLIAALQVWLSRTPAGRGLYAVGSNAVAARDSAIKVDAYIVGAFVFAGFCAGLAGVLESARVGVGHSEIGPGQMFAAITAVVIGGTSLSGGRGGVLQSTVGVLILAVLGSGMIFVGVSPYLQRAVQGAIILVAVIAATWHLRSRLRVVK